MREWLDLELSEAMRPVAAPDELWERVNEGAPARGRTWTALPIAAIVTLAIGAGTLWMIAKGETPRSAPPQYSQGTCVACHVS